MDSISRPVWSGTYFDGRSPRRHEVTITLAPEGVHIRRDDGSTLWWLFGQIRLAERFAPGEPVHLERIDAIGEVLLVPDREFLPALRQFAPGNAFSVPAAARISGRLPLVLMSAVVLAALAAAMYLWGIPALTRLAAARVPPEWEIRLGDAALAQMAPPEERCSDKAQQKIIDEIGHQLTAAAPPSPYRLQFVIVENPVANAFALPGGKIVIFRGLLEKSDRPEQLAGVMAHEIQHILLRHPLQAVLRQLSLRALAAVLAGDSSGMASALGAAGTLGGIRYQRGDEAAADREAVRMMQAARIDPNGLAQMLEKLQQADGSTPSALQYLSTHPLTANRIAEIRTLAAQSQEASVPLLTDADWSHMQATCRGI